LFLNEQQGMKVRLSVLRCVVSSSPIHCEK